MFNKFLIFFGTVLSGYSIFVAADPAPTAGHTTTAVKWLTNYDQAVQQSKSTSKPLVVFFTGSDWCGWCNKLDEEALDTNEFAEAAGSKFIFVKLDFPLYGNQDQQIKTHNKALQQKFDVRSFPTILILDPSQNQQIGMTGYRPGGGKAFAEYLLKLVNDYSGYKQKMSALDKSKYSGRDLKQIYGKAKELHRSHDADRIISKGMESGESLYFMSEKYRHLANLGKIQSKEAVSLKQQLLNADPSNEKQIHYQIAVIDFETFSTSENQSSEATVAPLITYIEKFGSNDKDNLWRLQLLISQVYLDNNEMTSALNYAQKSYESAPLCAQTELARVIQNISSQIHSSR